MPVNPGDLLQPVADAAREAVLERCEPKSCIATTRVVIETLRYFGVQARPWAVNFRVFTPSAWQATLDGVPVADWPEDAWSAGMTAATDEQVGHVVATAAGCLIDASADQIGRPAKGIPPVAPLVFRLPDDWDPAPGRDAVLVEAEGCHLVYGASGSRVYATQSPNWRRDDPVNRACTAQAIRAVRAQLAGAPA